MFKLASWERIWRLEPVQKRRAPKNIYKRAPLEQLTAGLDIRAS